MNVSVHRRPEGRHPIDVGHSQCVTRATRSSRSSLQATKLLRMIASHMDQPSDESPPPPRSRIWNTSRKIWAAIAAFVAVAAPATAIYTNLFTRADHTAPAPLLVRTTDRHRSEPAASSSPVVSRDRSRPAASTTTAMQDSKRCVPLARAERSIGLRLTKLHEVCAYERANVHNGTKPTLAICPEHWVCTWHEHDGEPAVLLLGDGQKAKVLHAVQRYSNAYPPTDPIRHICTYVHQNPDLDYRPEPTQPRCSRR